MRQVRYYMYIVELLSANDVSAVTFKWFIKQLSKSSGVSWQTTKHEWAIDCFRIPHNTLCLTFPRLKNNFAQVIVFKWSWEYSALLGAFQNNSLRKIVEGWGGVKQNLL